MKKKDNNMRTTNIMFNNDGRGGVTPKLSLPITWLRSMGLSKDDREVTITFNEETKQIIIEK